MKTLFLTISFFLFTSVLFAQNTLNVVVESFENNEGTACFYLFKEGQELSLKSDYVQLVKKPIINNRASVRFNNLASGNYAVMVFHDADKNGEMKHYFFGPPKEGVAASNNPKGHAKFEDASFYLESDLTLKIQMNYLFR